MELHEIARDLLVNPRVVEREPNIVAQGYAKRDQSGEIRRRNQQIPAPVQQRAGPILHGMVGFLSAATVVSQRPSQGHSSFASVRLPVAVWSLASGIGSQARANRWWPRATDCVFRTV